MSTERDVQHLIINKLTKAQYQAIANPDPDQLYLIIDDTNYAEVADLPQPSNTAPGMDGTAAAGIAATYSRSDHIHPTDTSRAPLNSPAFTGQPTTPTPLGVTTTINGISNVPLNNLNIYTLPNGASLGIAQVIGAVGIDATDADFLNVTFNGTDYILPRTGYVEFDGEHQIGNITSWGGATVFSEIVHYEDIEYEFWSGESDFVRYPLAIGYTEGINQGNSVYSWVVILPEDYDEENGTITISSFTSKPDGDKIVNVEYLDSVLENYESASSLRPEDDENVIQLLNNYTLSTPLGDDDGVLIDNDDTGLYGFDGILPPDVG